MCTRLLFLFWVALQSQLCLNICLGVHKHECWHGDLLGGVAKRRWSCVDAQLKPPDKGFPMPQPLRQTHMAKTTNNLFPSAFSVISFHSLCVWHPSSTFFNPSAARSFPSHPHPARRASLLPQYLQTGQRGHLDSLFLLHSFLVIVINHYRLHDPPGHSSISFLYFPPRFSSLCLNTPVQNPSFLLFVSICLLFVPPSHFTHSSPPQSKFKPFSSPTTSLHTHPSLLSPALLPSLPPLTQTCVRPRLLNAPAGIAAAKPHLSNMPLMTRRGSIIIGIM